MKRFNIIIIASVALSMFAVSCDKKEEQPALEALYVSDPAVPCPNCNEEGKQFTPEVYAQPAQQPSDRLLFTSPVSGDMKTRAERTVVVPEDVKATWGSVKLFFEDRVSKKSSEYVVAIGSEFNIPDTKLKIVVGEFLPDFRMDDIMITSNSNKPNNPAVRIEVFGDGISIFRGWLYANLPTVHPFEHERYKLILKEGVKK